jgi:hypothetical protein
MSILMAMLATALTKAVRMAKSTAAGEEMRQDRIGKTAKAVHEGDDKPTPEKTRQAARDAFRQVHTSGMHKITSSVLFVVRSDIEFRAYWHTLLNPANPSEPEFTKDGELVALTEDGERFELPRIGKEPTTSSHPITWEFISTHLNETGRGDAGGNVIYGDGRRRYVPYGTEYPMSKSVALLSHQFVSAFGE